MFIIKAGQFVAEARVDNRGGGFTAASLNIDRHFKRAGEVLRRHSGEGLDGPLSDASAAAMAILETHGVNGAACLAVLDQLETRCRRALAAASRVSQRAEAAARRWFHGTGFVS